jgi:hypothetical protein
MFKSLRRIFTQERIPQRIYTTDARLNAEPLPRNPDMLGRVWDGYRKLLDAQIDGNRRAAVDAVAEMQKSLTAYGNSLGNGTSSGTMRESGFGSLGTGGERPPEFTSRPPVTNEDIQRDNVAFWANGGRAVTGDSLALDREIARHPVGSHARFKAEMAADNARRAAVVQPYSKKLGKG